jgi:polyhydroxyalkanoate synthesis regulator phasin
MEQDLNNTTLLESLEDLVDQLGRDKITEEEATTVLESIVKYQRSSGEGR